MRDSSAGCRNAGIVVGQGRQRGAALIVGLLVLVLVSAAGVATMESSGLQLKMTSATQDRQQAFEAAEAALRVVEEQVDTNVANLSENDNMAYECRGDQCFTTDCTNGRCFQGVWLAGDSVKQCKIVDDGNYVSVEPGSEDCTAVVSQAAGGVNADNSGDTGTSDGDTSSGSTCETSSGNGNGNGAGPTGGRVIVEPPVYNAWESGSDSDYLNVWDDAGLHMTVDLDGHEQPAKYIVEFLCFVAADPVAELSDSNLAQVFRITTRGQSDSGRSEVMLQSTYKRLP